MSKMKYIYLFAVEDAIWLSKILNKLQFTNCPIAFYNIAIDKFW